MTEARRNRDERLPARIAVVSADATFLQAATDILESGGFSVTCLVAGPDVAARIIGSRPDLLCTDAAVPDEADQPLHLVRWAREQPEIETIPALLISADRTDVELGQNAHQVRTLYLTGPMESGPVLDAVRELIATLDEPTMDEPIAFEIGVPAPETQAI